MNSVRNSWRFFDWLGTGMCAAFSTTIDVASGVTGYFAKGRGVYFAALRRQLAEHGLAAVPLFFVSGSAIGIVAAKGVSGLTKSVGAEGHGIPILWAMLAVHIVPVASGLLIAARSSAAIAAELASARTRNEDKALELMGGNPMSVLGFPHIAALVASAIPLSLVLLGAAVVAAGLGWGGDFSDFFRSFRREMHERDILKCVGSSATFALWCGWVAVWRGLRAQRGATGARKSAKQTVVLALAGTIILDALFALLP